MTIHDIRFVQNRVSFPDALMAVAERLHLSRGGSAAVWRRWQAAWHSEPAQAHRILTDAEQLAMQDKAELAEFLHDEAAPAMFDLLRSGTLAALIDGRAKGLFRADPGIFADPDLFHSLTARNAPVRRVVCSHLDNLFPNGFADVASGHVVFRKFDILATLDTALPLPVKANDNPEPVAQPAPLPPPPVEPEPSPTMPPPAVDALDAINPPQPSRLGNVRSWDRKKVAALAKAAMRADPTTKSVRALAGLVAEQMGHVWESSEWCRAVDNYRVCQWFKDIWEIGSKMAFLAPSQ